MIKISKMIIPAAGIGSRFLPITKTVPKEMLPISSKPAIEYIVREAAAAKIHEMIMILSPQKSMIKDYFSPNPQLEKVLAEQKKSALTNDLNALIASTTFTYALQDQPRGVACALMETQHLFGSDEFFAMAYPDDIIFQTASEISNLVTQAQKHKAMIIAVTPVAREHISSYGVIAPKKQLDQNLWIIDQLVEKPSPEQAPSNLAIVGRFVLHSDIFKYIPTTSAPSGEILLPDTIKRMIQDGYTVLAYQIQGKRFDTGTPSGWIDCINAQKI